jgi:hypothetical protein
VSLFTPTQWNPTDVDAYWVLHNNKHWFTAQGNYFTLMPPSLVEFDCIA